MNGKALEERIFPAKDGEKMNKPKGIGISGDRLWVTDIDAVWIFDLRTKKQRKLALPGVAFANDPAVMGAVGRKLAKSTTIVALIDDVLGRDAAPRIWLHIPRPFLGCP